VIKHGVLGVKVHDAKLVAAMNVGGFARYQIEAIHPASLVS
jgi:hypothetical protein